MQQLLFVCNHISHSPRDERAEDYIGQGPINTRMYNGEESCQIA